MRDIYKTKHTPGPWVSGHVGKSTLHISGGLNSHDPWHSLAKVFVKVDGEPSKTGEANARLIRTSPELLDALREIEFLCDGREDVDDGQPNIFMKIGTAAREAIFKATGEPTW